MPHRVDVNIYVVQRSASCHHLLEPELLAQYFQLLTFDV